MNRFHLALVTFAMLVTTPALAQQDANIAVFLDGVDDQVVVPSHRSLDLTQEFTIEAWIAPENPVIPLGAVLSRSNSSSSDYAFAYLSSGTVNVTTGPAFVGPPIHTGVWSHYAWTHAPGLDRIYVNACPVAETDLPDPTIDPLGLDLHIGAQPFQGVKRYRGRLDDLRIWKVARSEAEIRSTINLHIGPGTAGSYPNLVSSWNFEGDGSDAKGVNHGIVQGNPFWIAADDIPVPQPHVTYCAAKVNSCGGLPSLTASGLASASAKSGFVITSDKARSGKSGLMLYGESGRSALPFQGGTLCLQTPLRRGPPLKASGTPGLCDGVFSVDWNAFASGAAGGNPAPFLGVPGTRVGVQCWGRDSVANGSYLSDAIEFDVCL